MPKDQDYYIGLLSTYIDGRLEPGQVEELFAFIRLEPMSYRSLLDTPAIRQQLTDRSGNESIIIPDTTSHRMLEKLLAATRSPLKNIDSTGTSTHTPRTHTHTPRTHAHNPRSTRTLRTRTTWYAAAAVLIIIAGIYLLTRTHSVNPIQRTEEQSVTSIPPGGNKATLTLAGGRTILLDSSATGQLAMQGNTTIIKNAEGQITYTGNGTTEALQNTLTTPRGGQYQLTLPDGTKVWVNAASSITYPTAFTGKERKVTIKGEAFFDVAQDKTKPFIVEVQDGPITQVLGTRFNINAYADEPAIRTTLITGSVKVQYNDKTLLLKPSQQAAANEKQLTLNPQPNIDEVTAWKNGSFLFSRTQLDIVMRQLSRWYDVDVVYTKGVPAIYFEGEMKRDLNLSEVLNILRKMEVHCKMDGRRLIVLP